MASPKKTPRKPKVVKATKLPPLPEIPDEVHTSVGPITVVWESGLVERERCVGKFEWRSRTITLDEGLAPHSAWATLYHELTHAWLMDAGLVTMDHEMEERVCDIVAAARVAELARGGQS
jgi:hypothetical protein